MNEQNMDDYLAALDRLKRGRPARVAKGTKITNDAVALEAGRGKGSIKKSRPVFTSLIAAIAAAAGETDDVDQQRLLAKAKTSAFKYREDLEAALGRELSLLHELYSVKKQLAALTGSNVLPLRGAWPEVGARVVDS